MPRHFVCLLLLPPSNSVKTFIILTLSFSLYPFHCIIRNIYSRIFHWAVWPPPPPTILKTDKTYRNPSVSKLDICGLPYQLEVIKDGVIVQTNDLKDSTKSFFVFGRLPACDIVLQHPSISRYHAILQYQRNEEQNEGWYLFDLGSTHGTYLNKQQIPSKVYCRVHAGHIFKLGVSTRLFILQGPEEDQEAVSQLTVTQLKELKQKRVLSLNNLEDQQSNEELSHDSLTLNSTSTLATSGVNWGMAEDAEDENPLAENPFAIVEDGQLNENLYLEDPKKNLRGWFEREGYELEYKVEEKSYAHFVCRVALPIDSATGAPIVAEASVKAGKKKEAVVQCALEACRILDRHGLLRQSKHESKVRRKKRQYDEDYYSSDEDTFLDRTGTVERKRQARMKDNKDCVETYETLSLKHQDIMKKMAEIQHNITKAAAAARKSVRIDTDDIDAYMRALQTEETSSKKSASVLRLQLSQLQREETKLKALIKIARPAVVSPVEAAIFSLAVESEVRCDSTSVHNITKTVHQPDPEQSTPVAIGEKSKTIEDLSMQGSPTNFKPDKTSSLTTSEKLSSCPVTTNTLVKKDILKPMEVEQSEGPRDDEKIGLVIRKRKKKGAERNKTEDIGDNAINTNSSNYNTFDDLKYAMWTPPEDQSGDGKNSLNTKYGY
nr:EOG090X026V [Ceriodaphnia reticulata]